MNISRDTAIAFALNEVKACKAMRERIRCTWNGGVVYAAPPCGQGFRILGVTNGEVYIPTYHRTAPPSIHWSTL